MYSAQEQISLIKKLLLQENLGDHIQPIEKLLRFDSYFLEETQAGSFTKIGGFPDLPKNTRWPKTKGFPMQFMMQWKLSDFSHIPIAQDFIPTKGLLYFFTDERQGMDMFYNEFDKKSADEIRQDFNKYPEKILKESAEIDFKMLYEPDEGIEVSERAVPDALLNYPVHIACQGFQEYHMVRDQIYLKPVEAIILPNEYMGSFSLDNIPVYIKLKRIWEFVSHEFPSSNIELFRNVEAEKRLFHWNLEDRDFEFEQVSLNPDMDGELTIVKMTGEKSGFDINQFKLFADFTIID